MTTNNDIVPVPANLQNNPKPPTDADATSTTRVVKESVSTATFVLLDQTGRPLLGFTKGKPDTVQQGENILSAMLPGFETPEMLTANFGSGAGVNAPTSAMLMTAEDAVSIRNWLKTQSVEVIVAVVAVLPPQELLAQWLITWQTDWNDGEGGDIWEYYCAGKMLDYLKGAK
jgi:hypothetical protein